MIRYASCMKEPVVMSWSGGKDSAMALQELLRSGKYEVVSLLTSVSEEYRRISHHGVRESLLDEQAKAIGIPLRKVYLPSGPAGGCTNDVYESIMKDVMLAYRRDGIHTVAFGSARPENLRARSLRSVTRPSFHVLKAGSERVPWAASIMKRFCATYRPT